MSFTELRFDDDGEGAPHRTEYAQAFAPLRLLDDSEVPASGELHSAPPCIGCFHAMAPVGASGWWCDPCQEYQ